MARSSGGGSRSGGSSHSSSHHSSGGGSRSSGSSRPSTSRTYSRSYNVRHSYCDKRGRRRTYFTSSPLDYSVSPAKKYRRSYFSLFSPMLFMMLIFFTLSIFQNYNGSVKLNAYNDSYAVVMDSADVMTDSEEDMLEEALRQFGRDTGIIPYVFTTDSYIMDDGFEYTDIEAYSTELYYKLFSDEDHILIVYLDDIDWNWWQIQGDNTYPLLDDSEFASFQTIVQNELYSGKGIANALIVAMDGFGEKIATFDVLSIIKTGLVSLIVPLCIFFPYIIIIFVAITVRCKKYSDEYNYYKRHGMPVAANNIKDICDHCGTSNPEKDEKCKYCGCSMIK